MTPLAHEIVKDSLLPMAKRKYGAAMPELRLLDGVHFFECSAVDEAARLLGQHILNKLPMSNTVFLPAPRTWLELRKYPSADVNRIGFLLEEKDDCAAVRYISAIGYPDVGCRDVAFVMPLQGNVNLGMKWIPTQENMSENRKIMYDATIRLLYALLAMINSPKVIGRRQHMPHRGLERRLLRGRGMVGRFPLQAWTEILLEVAPPRISDDELHEAHLTGRKALHFCRRHLRIRFGTLELVSAHWRGDPALGIKQSRYTLAPGRSAHRLNHSTQESVG